MHLIFAATLTLSIVIDANAFGGTRNVAHFESDQEWSQAAENLFAGTGRSLLGAVQRGPFIVTEGGEPWAYLTTINREKCHLLKKKLADLADAKKIAEARVVSCKLGDELQKAARLPSFRDFSPLSDSGKRLLFTQIFERPWKATNAGFNQTLFLHFERRIGKNDKDELDVNSLAQAYSTKRTVVFREARLWPIQIMKLAERRNKDGSHTFLIWGDRVHFETAQENGIQIAAVNTVLMDRSKKITLHPGESICSGDECASLDGFEFTILYSSPVILLKMNPKDPEKLEIDLLRTDGIHFKIILHYES